MRLLLGSGGFGTKARRAALNDALRAHFGAAQRLLFIPYARADHAAYLRWLHEQNLCAGYEVQGLHAAADPQQAVAEAQGIYVGGGNTFRLAAAVQKLGVLDALRRRVQSGAPYFGVSAGANLACPTIQTTNDMPIVRPQSFAALGLVPFQINAHFFPGAAYYAHAKGEAPQPHYGETREFRLREFHEENSTPVLGLFEGALLHREGGALRLSGAPARLFRAGVAPVDFNPGAELTGLL